VVVEKRSLEKLALSRSDIQSSLKAITCTLFIGGERKMDLRMERKLHLEALRLEY
jgi:hypothetical protein